MKHSKAALLIILLLTCSGAYAESETRNGNWWQNQSQVNQLAYILGIFDGMWLGANFSNWEIPSKEDGEPDVETAFICGTSFNDMNNKYMTNLTNLQVTDGVTKLYEDFRNRKIYVYDAVWLVVQKVLTTYNFTLKNK